MGVLQLLLELLLARFDRMSYSLKTVTETEIHREKCSCKQVEYVSQDWTKAKCPFLLGDVNKHRKCKNILVSIFCKCGREVGEMVFAGKKYVGYWRCYEAKPDNIAMKNVQEWLSLSFDNQLKTVAHSMVQLEHLVKRINKGLGKN